MPTAVMYPSAPTRKKSMVWMTVIDIILAVFVENSPFVTKFQPRSTIRPAPIMTTPTERSKELITGMTSK